MSEDKEKKAQIEAMNALVKTGNPSLVKMGLSMMPQEFKDDIKAITNKIHWYDAVVKELIAVYPRLEKWLSREKIKEVVPGSSLTASDAMDTLLKMVNNDREKVVQFFDTIVLDDEALNISMTYLCILPILLDNTAQQNPGITEEELKEGTLQTFITRLHLVPHVEGFPDTPETLYAALKAIFG